MAYSIIRQTSLPGVGEAVPKALYFIRTVQGGPVSVYITDTEGALHPCFDDAKTAQMIETSMAGFGEILVTANIASRNALVLTHNAIVLVEDASADTSVGPGSAFYFYMKTQNIFVLILAAGKGFRWSEISGGPMSTPAQIDESVSQTHTHVNKTVLDDLADKGRILQYKGKRIGTVSFDQLPEW